VLIVDRESDLVGLDACVGLESIAAPLCVSPEVVGKAGRRKDLGRALFTCKLTAVARLGVDEASPLLRSPCTSALAGDAS
jgi:hypothetical protein